MPDKEEENFCEKMAKATRGIHAISDALVNAKLAFGKISRLKILGNYCRCSTFCLNLPASCVIDCNKTDHGVHTLALNEANKGFPT